MSQEDLFSDGQIDQLVKAWQDAAEAMKELAEAICKSLEAVLNAIVEVVRAFTRWLFAIRLDCLGLPAGLATWIAQRWPWRWMPVRWIYGWISAP